MIKTRHFVGFIVFLVLADQLLKIYVKTHLYLGQNISVLGMLKFHFFENNGMALGMKLGKGDIAKLMLTLCRLLLVITGFFYLRRKVLEKAPLLKLAGLGLFYAGLVGNLLDNLFYGFLFAPSDPQTQNIATLLPAQGYSGLLQGKVVDMLCIQILNCTNVPAWVPYYGGSHIEVFSLEINLADVWVVLGLCISFIYMLFFDDKWHPANAYPRFSLQHN